MEINSLELPEWTHSYTDGGFGFITQSSVYRRHPQTRIFIYIYISLCLCSQTALNASYSLSFIKVVPVLSLDL